MNVAETTNLKTFINSIEVLIVVSAAFLCAHFTTTLLDMNGGMNSASSQTSVGMQRPQVSASGDLNNLFFPNQVAGASTSETVRAVESSLDIKLFGLRAEGNGMGSVIFKIGGQDQPNVRVGENMADKIKLLAVYHDRIEINNNGNFETVSFGNPNSDLLGMVEQPAALARSPQTPAARVSEPKQAPLMSSGYFKSVKDENGKSVGFVVMPEYAPFLAGTSFLPDDVILEINGERVHNAENLSEALETITPGTSVSMTVERSGVPKALSFVAPTVPAAPR